MTTIRIPVEANILSLLPELSAKTKRSNGHRLESLALGLALPSFWTTPEINTAFQRANKIWAQAGIEFGPMIIQERSIVVPADENGMWIAFVNKLRPKRGLSASFVFDLPSDQEGGWGGGRTAIVAGEKAERAIDGYRGRVLAHELGHCLLGDGHVTTQRHNLMHDQIHPRIASANLLNPDQITRARTRARTLG